MLAREGASVLLVDLHPERAEDTRQMIEDEGGEAEVLAADVTRAADCEAMVAAAVDTFGPLDILVNNIGLAALGTVVDTNEEAWDRAFAINLRTAFLASKYAVRHGGQGRGRHRQHLVDLRPARRRHRGLLGRQGRAARDDRRHGLRPRPPGDPGERRGPRPHHHAHGALGVGPGPRTDYMDTLRSEAGLLGTAGTGWDVGWAAAFLASDEARWITGVTLPVDSGVLSVTPLMMAPHLRAVPEP